MNEAVDRRYVDQAIRQLWMSYFELTDSPDFGRNLLSDQDLELFNMLALHPAMDSRLRQFAELTEDDLPFERVPSEESGR